MTGTNIEPMLLTVADGSRYSAISPSSIRRLYKLGFIEIVRIGGRVLLVKESLDRYIESLRANGKQ